MTNSTFHTDIGTFEHTNMTWKVIFAPRVIAQNEQIIRYFTEDLIGYTHDADIKLAHELQLIPEYTQNTQEMIELLYDDFSHMLRNGLINGIHLLLSETQVDPHSGAYPLRYHAMYLINHPGSNLMKDHWSQNNRLTLTKGIFLLP